MQHTILLITATCLIFSSLVPGESGLSQPIPVYYLKIDIIDIVLHFCKINI